MTDRFADFFKWTPVGFTKRGADWFARFKYPEIADDTGDVAMVWSEWKGPFATRADARRAIYFTFNVE